MNPPNRRDHYLAKIDETMQNLWRVGGVMTPPYIPSKKPVAFTVELCHNKVTPKRKDVLSWQNP